MCTCFQLFNYFSFDSLSTLTIDTFSKVKDATIICEVSASKLAYLKQQLKTSFNFKYIIYSYTHTIKKNNVFLPSKMSLTVVM